ncbi:MAG: hypothetical protein J7K75_09015 [Desulfuromonas sp.]|nr:hypothetical protein [Desulfuromonas sp.]
MKKILSALVWSLCFIVLLVVCDQFLLRYPGKTTPLLNDFQRFYQDFRGRLLGDSRSVTTIEKVISRQQKSTSKPDSIAANALHYVYANKNGELNFAKSLDEVPAEFRRSAQPLKND